MEIVGHKLGLHVEEPAVVRDPLPEGPQRLVVLHVPDVMAREGVAVLRQAECVLELPAARQGGAGGAPGQPQRRGRVAARAPEGISASCGYPKHTVVATGVDGAV